LLLIYQFLEHHFENESLLENGCVSPFIDSAIAKFLSMTRTNTSEGEWATWFVLVSLLFMMNFIFNQLVMNYDALCLSSNSLFILHGRNQFAILYSLNIGFFFVWFHIHKLNGEHILHVISSPDLSSSNNCGTTMTSLFYTPDNLYLDWLLLLESFSLK